jgi:uncharacterized membrane protein YsdA (DUF1294 family)/cold shock CspA family protein
MRFDGTLKVWNDDRGFGFIAPDQGGQELFVHIKAFPAGTGRPAVGQVVTFEVETGRDGKKRARNVQYPVRNRTRPPRREESPAHWTLPRLLALPVFVASCAVAASRYGFRPAVPVFYLVLSSLTFMAYAIDKSAAVAGRWRTPEQTLHLLGLAGGWPGALLAQQWLRHKTAKPEFITTFWLTAGLNTVACLAWQAGWLRLS